MPLEVRIRFEIVDAKTATLLFSNQIECCAENYDYYDAVNVLGLFDEKASQIFGRLKRATSHVEPSGVLFCAECGCPTEIVRSGLCEDCYALKMAAASAPRPQAPPEPQQVLHQGPVTMQPIPEDMADALLCYGLQRYGKTPPPAAAQTKTPITYCTRCGHMIAGEQPHVGDCCAAAKAPTHPEAQTQHTIESCLNCGGNVIGGYCETCNIAGSARGKYSGACGL